MKAHEVLKRYAAGDRDFRRTNLRGQNFKGQDLSGADFSEADIRGTNFTNAIVNGATFTRATAGVQKRWIVAQLLLLLALSALAGMLQGYFSWYLAYYFPRWWDSSYDWTSFKTDLATTIVYFVIIIAIFSAIARQGFTTKAVGSIAVAVAVAFAFAFAFAGAVAVAGAGAVAGAVAVAVAVAGAVAVAVAGAVAGAVAVAVAGAVAVAVDGAFAGAFAVAVAVASFLLGIYCSRRALQGDEKFALIRTVGIAFAALGGTRFYNANLTQANFTNATLKSTNFREATLTHVCWHHAKQLDRARVGESILTNAAIRDLLITGNGYHTSYINANLRGANLNGINLEQATLTGANLSNATLHDANLKDATLREVLTIGTDFTRAYLTGACLEGWNIDHTTTLKEVDCQYVFLLEQPNKLGNRERRPHEPDQVFAPGDFERLYTKMINIVQVLLRDGMNRAAFAAAFQQLLHEHPELSYDSIQAVERKGNDALVTLEVSETTDKAEVSRSLRTFYEDKVQQLEAKIETLHQLRAADLKEVALAQKAQFFNQLVGGNTMNDNTDQSQNFQVGGDFKINATNSVVNLRDLSGTVTNAINQLPDDADPGTPDLKQLLIQLKQAIETDADLPDADKADLLEQVQNLAAAKQTEEPAQKEGLARKAKKMFEATLKNLPDTAKLAEACSKLLPLILKAIGVPV